MKKIVAIWLNLLLLFSFALIVFAQNDSPLKILSTPTPGLTKSQLKLGNIEVQGAVLLRAEFLANGQIGKVSPVSSLPFGLTENAIEAAHQIKFEPAIKGGIPISVFKPLQYNFQAGWIPVSLTDEKAEAILKRAIEKLGGERYLQVKTQISTGNFTLFKEGTADLPNSFTDIISFPDKERTEFKQSGIKTIQTNFGEKGWVYDGGTKNLRPQGQKEIDNFKRGLRTSIDSLLRGVWRNQAATLTYLGRREAGIGIRNEVVKLTYSDGLTVEFEFSTVDGLPIKALFKGQDADQIEAKEEDRYAQFIEVQGVYVPFIVDHHINLKQTSRINYFKIELNKAVPDSIFDQPADVKDLKKDLKF